MRPFLIAAITDWTRTSLLRDDAAQPIVSEWALAKPLVYTALLIVSWAGAAPIAGLVVYALEVAGATMSPAACGLLTGLFSVALGALVAVSAIARVNESETALRSWPIPPAGLFIPDLAVALVQGLAIGLVTVAPSAAILALTGGASSGQALAASAASLALALATGVGLTLLAGTALWLRLVRTPDGVLAAVSLAAAAMASAGAILLSRSLSEAGLSGLASVAAAVENAVGFALLASLGNGTGGVVVAVAGLAVVVAGVPLTSTVLERTRFRVSVARDRSGQPSERTMVSPRWSGRLGPFLRKDLIIVRRQPGILLRQVLTVAVFVAMLVFAFPEKQPAFLVFAILAVPASLCGVATLHEVGQEGSLLNIVRAAGAGRRLVASKLAVNLVTMPVLSSLLAAGTLLLAGNTLVGLSGLRLVAFSALAAVIDVVLALGLGLVFLDLSVKRIGKDRGVTIAGDLLYWVMSGVVAVGLYFLASPPAGTSHVAVAGFIIVVAGTLAACVLYQIGLARLERADESGQARLAPSAEADDGRPGGLPGSGEGDHE